MGPEGPEGGGGGESRTGTEETSPPWGSGSVAKARRCAFLSSGCQPEAVAHPRTKKKGARTSQARALEALAQGSTCGAHLRDVGPGGSAGARGMTRVLAGGLHRVGLGDGAGPLAGGLGGVPAIWRGGGFRAAPGPEGRGQAGTRRPFACKAVTAACHWLREARPAAYRWGQKWPIRLEVGRGVVWKRN